MFLREGLSLKVFLHIGCFASALVYNNKSPNKKINTTWSISCNASSGAIRKPPFPKPSRWDKTAHIQVKNSQKNQCQWIKQISQLPILANQKTSKTQIRGQHTFQVYSRTRQSRDNIESMFLVLNLTKGLQLVTRILTNPPS